MSILPRVISGLIKSSWWLFVVCLVLVAIYVSAGRFFVYSISSYQLQIEKYLHDRGFSHVEIGRIEGGWHHFDPQFYVTDFRLGQSSASALEIDQLSVRFGSFRSLLSRWPVVTEIEVSGIRFTLDRDDAGRIRIRGLLRDESRDGGSFDWRYLLDSLLYLDLVRLSDMDVSVPGFDTELHLRSDDDQSLIVSAGEAGKILSLSLYLDRTLPDDTVSRSRVWLAGEYQGDIRDSDFNADLYLDAPHVGLEHFLSGQPWLMIGNRRITSANLAAEVWLSVRHDDVDITGKLALRNVLLNGDGGEITLLDSAEAEIRFVGGLSEGSVFIPGLFLKIGSAELELNDLQLALDSDENGMNVAARLPRLELAGVTSVLSELADKGFVSERVGDGLDKVNLRGDLTNLLFSYYRDVNTARFVSSITDVAMDAYRGLPTVDRINGLLSLTRDQGYIDINNDQFTMNFISMFDQAWPFTSARGRIRYKNEAGYLVIDSSLLEFTIQEQMARGKVLINLPPETEQQTWGLIIGGNNARLLDAKRFIPKKLSSELKAWLKTGVKGGTGTEFALVFHGALFRGSPAARKAHDLFFKVDDTRLGYHEGWPEIEGIEATVHVSNYAVSAKNAVGRVYDSNITSAEVLIPIDAATRQADTIVVNATFEGPTADVVRVLNETPLSEILHQMTNTWSADGEATTKLHLNIPLGARVGEKIYSDVRVALQNSHLVMPEFGLDFSRLTGTASYNNDQGFTSAGFKGVVFREPVEGNITSRLYGDGGEVVVNVKGSVDARDLYRWSDQILLSRVEGKADYAISLHVPYGGEKDKSYVEASSDLTGMTIDLPEPFRKLNPDTVREFTYRQNFLTSGYLVELQLGDQVAASLKTDEGVVTGGRVHFGEEPFGAVVYDAVRVTGRLPLLDYKHWSDLMDDFEKISDTSLETSLARHIDSMVLDVNRLSIFGLELEDVATTVTRQEGHWLTHISHKSLSGLVKLSDREDDPIEIDFEFLSFSDKDDRNEKGTGESRCESEKEDPFAGFNPLEITAFDFSTKKLVLNGNDYGAWSFDYRIEDGAAHLNNFGVTMKGLQVLDTSSFIWRSNDGKHQSHFQGDIQIDNLAEALPLFGLASSIEAKGLKLSADVIWHGSPAMPDINRLQGNIKIHEGEGRFVQAEAVGALKLLGIFDFAQLARRFRLDFSDITGKGFEFSDISGETALKNGVIEIVKPLVIHGTAGKFKIGGSINLSTQELDNDMIVTLPVSRTLPWYAAYSAIATGPLAGVGVMIARQVFRKKIDQFSSAKYKISGTIDEPDIEFVSIFNDTVRESSSTPATE